MKNCRFCSLHQNPDSPKFPNKTSSEYSSTSIFTHNYRPHFISNRLNKRFSVSEIFSTATLLILFRALKYGRSDNSNNVLYDVSLLENFKSSLTEVWRLPSWSLPKI